MKKAFVNSLKILFVMTIITGVIYPLIITGFAQIFYPAKANGSIIVKSGKQIGSKLIGQQFSSDKYFWSRPSAIGNNPMPSGGSNYGPTSDTLKKLVEDRWNTFTIKNGLSSGTAVPTDMLFTSASGVDPHISPQSAILQVNRISNFRKFNEQQKEKLINLITGLTEKPQFGVLGDARINVLTLNLALDKLNE